LLFDVGENMISTRITTPVKALVNRFPVINAAIWDLQYRLGMWDDLDRATGAQVIALLERYTVKPDILDLGCGKGINLHLAETGYGHYHGVDISTNSIQTARKHARPNTSFEVGDILRYQTAERYDAILLREVLYYIPMRQIDEFLRRTAGFLKPSGKIFIQLWDKNSCTEYIEIIANAGFRLLEEQVAKSDEGPESTVIVLQASAPQVSTA
jgi:2-polyprenyl-3-methyl-5-hydroxy-6-metoxy-1,4-benzoquinol methylase